MRRASYDALLAHIATLGALVLLFLSAAWAGALTAPRPAYLTIAFVIPSFAFYIVRVMEAGESRDRANRLVMAYIKGAAHLSFGFGVWLICFIIVYRIAG